MEIPPDRETLRSSELEGLELSCKTAAQRLWVHLLADNMIRQLTAQDDKHVRVDLRELSFKHTVQLVDAAARDCQSTRTIGCSR